MRIDPMPWQARHEEFGIRERVIVFRRIGLLLQQLDVQTERLQLADEDVERLRQTGIVRNLALDDGLVDLGAALDVVRLDREQLQQGVRGAIGLESPDFHLSETLAAELGLAAQGLLGDE